MLVIFIRPLFVPAVTIMTKSREFLPLPVTPAYPMTCALLSWIAVFVLLTVEYFPELLLSTGDPITLYRIRDYIGAATGLPRGRNPQVGDIAHQ